MHSKQANDLEPVRFSRLNLMARSAAHFAHGTQQDEAEDEDDDTAAMRKGSATHAYLLGQADRVTTYTEGARNKKHKKYQDFMAANPDKLILSPKEFAMADGMRRSIQRHARALELLDGIQEERIWWDIGGRSCAGTPDVVKLLAPRGDVVPKRVVELKTCRTSAPHLFQWLARKAFYHAQVAWYAEGVERTLVYPPGPVEEHYVVAVESTAPYPVTVLRVRPSMLTLGRKQWRLWWEQLQVCEASGRFPAYVESDVDWEDEEAVELEWDEAAA